MPSIERELGEIAGRQDNVISRAQLFELGVPRRAIERRLESGRWRCLHRGVYLIGPAPPTLFAAGERHTSPLDLAALERLIQQPS
jgi:Transcriptional regulator, AbiEi antitoxin